MKYVKMLGLLAVAAAALMAFAGAASATTITSSTGETPTIHAVSVGYATLHNGVGTISCNSTVHGKVESHGAGKPATGKIETLSFTGCTNGTVHTVAGTEGHVKTPGSLSITGEAPTGNGILTSSGATVVVTLGVECGYSTSNTQIGTLDAKEHSVLTINATLERHSGSFFCGATAKWTGEYRVNHPTNLSVH